MRAAGPIATREAAARIALLVALAACGDGALPADGPTAPDGPWAVGRTTRTFVDASRPTGGSGDAPAQDARTLVTKIWYPAEGAPGEGESTDADPARGPFPLIVFAHGFQGVADVYRSLHLPWAERGYVVAAPDFPLSSSMPGRPPIALDYVNQPADVSFVIDSMLALAADASDPLGHAIDRERIGVAGQSLGGFTTMGVAFHECCADPRIDAAVPMAARLAAYPGGGDYFPGDVPPVLVVHGDLDETVPWADGRAIYDAAPRPRFLVTVLGGDHILPYVASPLEPTTEPVRLASLAFFDLYLKGRREALRELLGIDALPLARLDADP